jgi:mono/diheme cytochrome c family protein
MVCIVAGIVVNGRICVAVEPAKQADESITFEKHVRPILKAHCFHCHGEAGVVEAELDVRLRRWLIRGGESGESIIPGDVENSLLLERMESGEMPPGEERVSGEEIAVVKSWILSGAMTARAEPETLDEGDYITQEERSFWAFQPIRRPEIPSLQNGSRELKGDDPNANKFTVHAETPVDHFVQQKIKSKGLDLSPLADRHTRIRRLSFDLLGLPPTEEMVDQFIGDQSPHAYERLVDRLLASPEYGERWGRHWLDVAGYADSDGYTDKDIEREFAYFYRDYVVESFNRDQPFDQFVREQLAGDELLPASQGDDDLSDDSIAKLAATGFLRMAPDGTSAGGVDRAEAANQNIADTIQIMSSAFLGLTVGCARCHDHRYDPISQADYYRMRAILEPALDWKQWKTPAQRRVSLYTNADRAERDRIEEEAKAAEKIRNDAQAAHIARTLYEELLVVPDDLRDSLKEAYETEKAMRNEQQVALLEEYPSVGNISPGSLYLYAEQRARRAGDIERVAKQKEEAFLRQATMENALSLTEDEQQQIRELLDTPSDQWDETQKSVANEFGEVFVTVDQLAEVKPDAFATLEDYRQAAEVCRSTDAKTDLAKQLDAVKAIRATAPKEHFVRVLQEPPGHTPKTHLFIRGDHQQPDRELVPSELTVLLGDEHYVIPEDEPSLPTTGRRLAYAKQLTSAEHPLLARVIVNRIWMHHFGRGIVATPGDFGRLGARPTHPELLDWLASELITSGWSVKKIHKLILCSYTYQQQSTRNKTSDEIDPDNLWLARMPVRRLESEAFRDAMLWVSGELVPELFGPPISVKEDSVGQIVVGKEMLDGERKPTGADTDSKGGYRRSLYIQVRRSRPLAVLESFDLPLNTPNCELRFSSNVATQSLMMMNSQFAIDRSEHFAKQLIELSSDPSERIELAWQRCFSTPIDEATASDFVAFVNQQRELFAAMDAKRDAAENEVLALASACQAMMSSNAFLYVD